MMMMVTIKLHITIRNVKPVCVIRWIFRSVSVYAIRVQAPVETISLHCGVIQQSVWRMWSSYWTPLSVLGGLTLIT